jgi:hypothetical protein
MIQIEKITLPGATIPANTSATMCHESPRLSPPTH